MYLRFVSAIASCSLCLQSWISQILPMGKLMMMISSISSLFNSECVLFEIKISFIYMIGFSFHAFFVHFFMHCCLSSTESIIHCYPQAIFCYFFQFCPSPLGLSFPRIAMETYIRQRQLIMSPLIPSRVIGENEPLAAVFNKVIATREVNHKGQGKSRPKGPSK